MNILVVDDEEDIREILGFALEAEVEADCTFVKSGNEAWEKIESKDSFDLIICDYNMPDGNGGDLYRHLLDNEIAIPFVLCSSISAIEKSDFDNKSYLIGQIEKPFIYEGVLSTLEKFNVVKEGFPDDIESVIRNQSKYISVDFNLIEKLKTTPCNIFLKLNKDKHIKIFNKKIKIYQSDLSKYKDLGVEFSCFFSPIDRKSNFLKRILNSFILLILATKTIIFKKSLELLYQNRWKV